MTDKMVDVGRRHFLVEFSNVHTNIGGQRRRQYRRECRKTGPTMSAADTRRHSGRHSVCYPSGSAQHHECAANPILPFV